MAKFEEQVVIVRPADEVFAFISDLTNDPPWSGAAEVRRASNDPIGVGTKFEQHDRMFGRPLAVTLEVVGYEPNHSITLKSAAGAVSFEGTRVVEPAGADATRVTFLGDGHARGALKLAESLMAAIGRRRLRTQLAKLKSMLESR